MSYQRLIIIALCLCISIYLFKRYGCKEGFEGIDSGADYAPPLPPMKTECEYASEKGAETECNPNPVTDCEFGPGCEREHIFTVPGVPETPQIEITGVAATGPISRFAAPNEELELLCYPTHQKHKLNQHQLVDNKF